MRILVLGAGGMLGHKMYSVLSREYPETHGFVRKPAEHYAKFGIFKPGHLHGGVDVRDFRDLSKRLDALRPDAIVNCVGLTTRKLGAYRESDIADVNSVLPIRLKEWCEGKACKLVHFSTDCVFSGHGGPYSPDAPKDAKDFYGASKALGEVEGKGVLTIRSSIIGLEIEGKTELLEWFLAQRGRTVRGFRKVMYSGVTTQTMANVVLKLFKNGVELSGVHQLASPAISKHELISLANEIFGVGATIEAIDHPVSNKVLIQSAFFDAAGIKPPPWREQLRAVADDLKKHEGVAA